MNSLLQIEGNVSWIYILGCLIGLLITFLIIKGAINSSKLAKYQKAQLKLMAAIAEHQGVEYDLIEQIVFESDPEFATDRHFQRETENQNNLSEAENLDALLTKQQINNVEDLKDQLIKGNITMDEYNALYNRLAEKGAKKIKN
jgi:hypothetical protein